MEELSTNINISQTTTNTYANRVKTPNINTSPKKEQAIILHAINEIHTNDYIIQIGKLINPKNIIFASRISNERICIYLSSKAHVEQLISKHPNITIGNQQIEIRRLINPSKRLIISNICPTIPNKTIEEKLVQIGFKLVSPINFMKIGI